MKEATVAVLRRFLFGFVNLGMLSFEKILILVYQRLA